MDILHRWESGNTFYLLAWVEPNSRPIPTPILIWLWGMGIFFVLFLIALSRDPPKEKQTSIEELKEAIKNRPKSGLARYMKRLSFVSPLHLLGSLAVLALLVAMPFTVLVYLAFAAPFVIPVVIWNRFVKKDTWGLAAERAEDFLVPLLGKTLLCSCLLVLIAMVLLFITGFLNMFFGWF